MSERTDRFTPPELYGFEGEEQEPQAAAPQKSALERRARLLAARKMRLVKDVRGLKLPDVLWTQMLPAAHRELAAEALLDSEPF